MSVEAELVNNMQGQERGYLLDCGCRVEKTIIEIYHEYEGNSTVVSWWSACPIHEGASSGDMLELLNEQHPLAEWVSLKDIPQAPFEDHCPGVGQCPLGEKSRLEQVSTGSPCIYSLGIQMFVCRSLMVYVGSDHEEFVDL